jgi:hypothetical protein
MMDAQTEAILSFVTGFAMWGAMYPRTRDYSILTLFFAALVFVSLLLSRWHYGV